MFLFFLRLERQEGMIKLKYHVYDISAEDGDWKLGVVGIKVARPVFVMGLHPGPFSSRDSFGMTGGSVRPSKRKK